MELGTILRVTRDRLRAKYNWAKDECRITSNGEPLEKSPEFFVGIVDSGTEGSPTDGYFLSETFRLEVWVWRRLGQYSKDRQGNAMIDEDPHLGNVCLPSGLERKVKKFIHMNYSLITAINEAYGTGTIENGSGLQHPFVYQGSGRTQIKDINDGGNSIPAYVGRMIRFGGALHIDPICENDQ